MRGVRSKSAGMSFPLVMCLAMQAMNLPGRPAFAAEAGAAGGPGATAIAETVSSRPAGGAMLTVLNVRTPATACHRLDEVDAALFPNRQPVGYDFAGPDAGRLNLVLHADAATAFADVAVIRLVLLFSTREAIAFQFGADGCHITTIDLRIDEMGAAFDRAGVYAPFGSTYYQGTGRAI